VGRVVPRCCRLWFRKRAAVAGRHRPDRTTAAV